MMKFNKNDELNNKVNEDHVSLQKDESIYSPIEGKYYTAHVENGQKVKAGD